MSTSKKAQPYTSKLKGVSAWFNEAPATEAINSIDIDAIRLPTQQPRRYFDPEKLEQLVASVKEHGILEPLLVRPLTEGAYELVAGERRYRAARTVGLAEVPVVVRELNDEAALQLSLIENLQREDLNPVEETEGILQLLALKLNRTPQAAIDLLTQAAHPERAAVDNVIHTQEWQLVQEVFATVGKLTPESFRTNRLPLLKLPQEVLNVLRQGQIAYTKARAIAKVKDPEQRRALLESAISENLSLAQIQERIKALRPALQESQSLKARLKVASTQLQKAKCWDNPKKQKALEKLLAQMEALLAEA